MQWDEVRCTRAEVIKSRTSGCPVPARRLLKGLEAGQVGWVCGGARLEQKGMGMRK